MNIDNKRENEKAAQDHISNNKLNNLFKELINTVVHDQPVEPIQYMVRLFLESFFMFSKVFLANNILIKSMLKN